MAGSLAFRMKDALKRMLSLVGLDVRLARPFKGELAFLREMEIGTVLDIGAHAGEFASQIRRILPHATLHSFEPLPVPFALLCRTMRADPRFFAHNVAIGQCEGELEMFESSHTPSSSLLPMAPAHARAFPYTAQTTRRVARVTTLDSWSRSAELADPLMIKLDVQGYEDRVIAGGRATFGRAAILLVEVSFTELYVGQMLFDELYDTVRALGFRCRGMVQNLRDPALRIVSADAIFMKDTSQAMRSARLAGSSRE